MMGRPQRYAFKGQGLLEFALVLPLLLIVAVGVLDLGRVFFVLITVSNASREGARYLSFTPEDRIYASDPFHGTKLAAVNEATSSIITLATTNVICACSDITPKGKCASGSTATVTVNYQLDLIVGWVLPSPITLSRTTRMLVP
jgi:Flp pilus assembly protein TadG